ncbi:putative metal-binding motif-containing protein, partial [Myxococcus sp. CA039A]|uniref:putative metal-binding motif-containing protein n=1 Tax=Myxococcus sp. CA039A TaxID=2741737 RepID=UPI00157ADFE4
MSRMGSLVVVSLLVLGGCSVPSLEDLEAERGVRIKVDYSPGFTKGCIVMQTQDEANAMLFAEESISGQQLVGMTPPLEWRVLRREGWGTKVRVIITAREQSCEGHVVAQERLSVDLSGEGRKPERTVQLATPDGDNDGFVANGSGGTDCDDSDSMKNPSQPEICDDKDNNCVGGADEGLTRIAMFRDADDDGVGGEAIQHCVPTSGVWGYATTGGDCRDHDPAVTPGKAELCDSADNNCDGNADEAFPTKNTSCTLSGVSCAGTWVCNSGQSDVECNARPPRLFYPDRDHDGDGDQNATVDEVCANETPQQGHVENLHTDCDDADPGAKLGLTEVCDAIDNNCSNGVSDEPLSCGGTLRDVVSYHLTSESQDWRTVAVGQGGYPVWV